MSVLKTMMFQVEDGVATITFNRPEVLNAINDVVLNEFNQLLDLVEQDDDIRVMVVTGNGKAFIAGADISALKSFTVMEGKAFTIRGQKILNKIEGLSKPVIAAINGYAMGGGLELALACDFRIASDKAKLGVPETKLGIFPGFGGTQRLTRVTNYGTAKYMIFSGDPVTAQKALELGIVQEVVPAEILFERVKELANKIKANGPIALKMAKKAVQSGMNMDLENAIKFEAETYTTCFVSEDRVEGMSAFLEKRTPVFKNR